MAAVIPVGTSAVKISGTASKPYLISNDPESQTTIYIGQYSNVSAVNYGVKLSPGGTLTWTEITSEVWAISANSDTANVTVIYEASATFSSQVSNLAASSPVLLVTKTIPVQISSVTTFQSAYINSIQIAQYSSLRVTVSTTINNTGGVTTTSTSLDSDAWISFSAVQADTPISNASYKAAQQAVWPLGSGSSTSAGNPVGLVNNIRYYEIPVNNIYLTGDSTAGTGTNIRVNTGTLTAVSLTVTIRIYGTYTTKPKEIYYNGATGGFPTALGTYSNPEWGVMAVLSDGNKSYPLPSYNGEAVVSMYSLSTTLTAAGYYLNTYSPSFLTAWGYPLGSGYLATPTIPYSNQINTFIFPNVPVRLTSVSTGTTPSISVIQTRQ